MYFWDELEKFESDPALILSGAESISYGDLSRDVDDLEKNCVGGVWSLCCVVTTMHRWLAISLF